MFISPPIALIMSSITFWKRESFVHFYPRGEFVCTIFLVCCVPIIMVNKDYWRQLCERKYLLASQKQQKSSINSKEKILTNPVEFPLALALALAPPNPSISASRLRLELSVGGVAEVAEVSWSSIEAAAALSELWEMTGIRSSTPNLEETWGKSRDWEE